MNIECLTIRAAVDILQILLSAGLYPSDTFRIDSPDPPDPPEPPVHFSFSAAPPAELLEQLQAIPDVRIVDTEAA